jgi:epsilon-lactone hydrolase
VYSFQISNISESGAIAIIQLSPILSYQEPQPQLTMPSPESQALTELYSTLASIRTSNPTLDIQALRYIHENLAATAAEPTDVTYEEVGKAGTCHALWCKPLTASAQQVILYTHGGGFATGSSSSHRKMVGHLAKAASMPALSLDYRLAPEHPFPAQIEDTVEAYRWLLKQGFKPRNIATAGDSAGGSLAVAVVLRLRELGEPIPGAVVGLSPWVDMEMNGVTLESNKATDPLIDRDMVNPLVDGYLGLQGNPKDPLANPLYADLKGMPPMYVSVGTYETLQDNGERLAERAREAGVDVTLEQAVKMQHVHTFMAGAAPEADQTIENVGKWLKAKLNA